MHMDYEYIYTIRNMLQDLTDLGILVMLHCMLNVYVFARVILHETWNGEKYKLIFIEYKSCNIL